jgi:hypothetical protein
MLWSVDAVVRAGWWSWRRTGFAAVAALVVALVATALGLFFWARSYAPLYSWGGSSFPEPSQGARPLSLGIKEDPAAYVVHPGLVTIRVDVSSNGRWPIRIEGLELALAPNGMSIERIAIRPNQRFLATRRLPRSGWSVPLGGRKRWGQEFTVTFNARCTGLPRGTYSSPMTRMRFRYHYLRYFTRSQEVPLVAPMVLAC